jgi:dihydroorotase
MSRLLFHGGQVAGSEAPPTRADVLVDDGVIVAVEPDLSDLCHRGEPAGRPTRIDCVGQFLLPGLFDVHAHLREPGREEEETLASGALAGWQGGFTGLLAMPNTEPAIDNGGMVRFVLGLARETARIPVHTAGCLSRGRAGKVMAEIGDMVDKGARLITDDNAPVTCPDLLAKVLAYARHFDVPVAVHPETPALMGRGVMHDGPVAYRLGLPGIPACGEEICVDRDLRLARHTGGRLHIQQVSTAGSLEILRRFKHEGVRVTAEVSPHHLLLTEADVGDYNTHAKMLPPLRTEADRAALLEGLRDGTLDMLATAHAPHTEFEKNLDFQNAPFGIVGLETALPALFDGLIRSGALDWATLVRAFCRAPRALLGLPDNPIRVGERADFIRFDPSRSTVVSRDWLLSRSHNSPWLGRTLAGLVLPAGA